MSHERYDRQLRIPGFGAREQERLARSRVLVVGAGGLGSPVILYLAAAGVGTLSIADGDRVALSNLNRQILHGMGDLGSPKVLSAAQAVESLNPEVEVDLYQERLDAVRAIELAAFHDLLVDASDGFDSKYLLNRAAVETGTPLLHAGVEGMVGQLAWLALEGGPCLRCIFGDPPSEPTEPRPILGAVAGVLGALQASEAIKHLAGLGTTLRSRLLVVDLERPAFDTIPLQRDPACPACGSETSPSR